MSTQSARDGAVGGDRGGLPDAVPVSLDRTTRLSWELGDRVTTGADATLAGEWRCRGTPWAVAAFDVTDNTAVLRVRTPVGRELFYGVADPDVVAARDALAEAPDWERLD
ncbi:hypothetical protein [Halosimplex halophilum]|uniref:hypothetical protein n=1 Tax=Halosimplex halophilum TaxID=2559572 RepID=UPI00107F5103|nr:hypothetical protein [Halosimplex halophilum]